MTAPRELVYELQSRFGPLLLDHSFPLDDRGRLDLDLVRRICRAEGRDRAAGSPSASRPSSCSWSSWPPTTSTTSPGRTGSSAAARAASPRCTASSTRRSASCSTPSARRRRERARRLRPRRRLARRRRQPQRLARAARATSTYADRPGYGDDEMGRAARAPAASSCGARLPEAACATRSSSGCRGLRERAYELRGYTVDRLVADARVLVRDFGNIVLNVRGRERYGIVEPGDEYERVRDEIVERALRAPGARGRAPSSPRCTGARSSSTGPSSRRSPTSSSSSATTRGSARAT